MEEPESTRQKIVRIQGKGLAGLPNLPEEYRTPWNSWTAEVEKEVGSSKNHPGLPGKSYQASNAAMIASACSIISAAASAVIFLSV